MLLFSACLTSDLADVDGRHLRGADGRVTRRVGKRLARPDGQLLLLPGGHDLLGDCNTQTTKHTSSRHQHTSFTELYICLTGRDGPIVTRHLSESV